MVEPSNDCCVCSDSLIHCELDGCGHSVSEECWEDHLLAHQLSDVVDPFTESPVKEEESVTVETTPASEEVGTEAQCQNPQSQEQLPDQKDTLEEKADYTKETTSTSAVDAASSSDESDAECGICNQSVKIAHISDHMIVHELQVEEAEEESDQSTKPEGKNDLGSNLDEADVCTSQVSDNLDSELKEEFSELAGSVKTSLQDMKQEMGQIKITEMVEGVSKLRHEDLEEVTSAVVDAKKEFKELESDIKDAFEDITIEDVFKAGLSCAKAVSGLTKDWWSERKAKKQKKSQPLISAQEPTPMPPATAVLSLASETLGPHISELVNRLGIPEDWLDQICSDEHLLAISEHLTDWKYVAHQLSLGETDIEEIEMDRSINVQRYKVLQKWKQKYYIRATYRKLLEVFFTVKRSDYADLLGRLLSGVR